MELDGWPSSCAPGAKGVLNERTDAAARTDRSIEIRGADVAHTCSVAPRLNVVHVPASRSSTKSTAERPCTAKTCSKSARACGDRFSALRSRERMYQMWLQLIVLPHHRRDTDLR
eukprot:7385620-Prymnesium_polylepis.1